MVHYFHHIIIADNQYLITEAMQKLIGDEIPDVETVLATNKPELVRAMLSFPKSLVILDHHLLGLKNILEIKEIILHDREIRMVILTNALQDNEIAELTTLGVRNIMLKTADRDELLDGLRSALARKNYYCQQVLERITEIHHEKPVFKEDFHLTAAEIEIIKAIAEGYTTKQIAETKHLSHHTVNTHRKKIFRKLHVNNTSELLMLAIRKGIVDVIDYQI
jgi:DNA-binding NarL/FixJ family response regulator